MNLLRVTLLTTLALAMLPLGAIHAQNALRVTGSTTVNAVVADAAEHLRAEKGMKITVDTAGGSTGGISALADGRADVGMSSRALNAKDSEKYPGFPFNAIHIGEDAVAIVVSKDVWEGGVKALSKAQLQQIYEGKARNWQEFGGPDRRIIYFNKEPGRGTWEVFAAWLYGKSDAAPKASHPEVGANAEVRSKVGGSRGAISIVSAMWADGETIYAVRIELEGGEVVAPETRNIANHSYPLARPLFLLTKGEPTGDAKMLVDYILSPAGQTLMPVHGYIPLAELTE